MQTQQKSSCFERILTSVILFIVSSIAGGVCVAAITFLYPQLNPILTYLLTDSQIPFATNLAWLFWVALPFLFNLVFAFGLSLSIKFVSGRRQRSA
jgi:hypothetical protein